MCIDAVLVVHLMFYEFKYLPGLKPQGSNLQGAGTHSICIMYMFDTWLQLLIFIGRACLPIG